MFNVDEYQDFCDSTAIFPYVQDNHTIVAAMYCALGLVGEAGEVAEKVKKWHRDGVVDKQALVKEMGDVTWYLAELCSTMDIPFHLVFQVNMEKLQSRKERGQLGGNGDNR